MTYAYDDEILERVRATLFEALPALYRVPDEPRKDLQNVLEVLAAPLAVLRQSIQELQADLFIDTADDRMVPYLAEMVGTRLAFPDAASNRRDVRGTVSWRRRKGTPAALEEMGAELTGQSVVLQEGWKRLQLAQDLNLVRAERVVPDLRPAIVAEQATGPLDALHHALDVRRISARTGRFHPRHVAHWLQPTVTFPLREATAVDRSGAGTDARFAIDPLGVRRPLRARRPDGDSAPFVDRILEQHFAAAPERWFGRAGGFTIRICGLDAGIAGRVPIERVAAEVAADPQLGLGAVTLTALERPSRGWRGGVRVELGLAVAIGAGAAGGWRPDPSTLELGASIDLDAAGATPGPVGTVGDGTGKVPLLRLTPLGGATAQFFPGATLELASAEPGATAEATEDGLAREGFLRGVLHVTIPPLDVRGERLLAIAADGSLYSVDDLNGVAIEMPDLADLRLSGDARVCAGPGPAWPPLPARAEPRMLTRVPAAPGRGPAVLHGATPLIRSGDTFSDIGAADCALAFAAQLERPGGAAFEPFLRLAWTGGDPSTATWTATGDYAAIATLRDDDPDRIALAVRFECSVAATLCPGEVAWSADDGRTVLIHLPQLEAAALAAGAEWPAPVGFASEPVRVGEDGSTWASDSTAGRRLALGAVAPIFAAAGLRRRRVRWRRLCAWYRETATEHLAYTARGRLDVDVLHGLFACAAEEPPQAWPAADAGGASPPSVTTDYEEGATLHLGARPAAREPVLDVRLARPTRLVARGGALHPNAPADWHAIPRYETLAAALAATGAGDEVVQFEDSATYPGEAPVWPAAPSSLTIQAAERERPTVLVTSWTGAPEYAALTVRGIAVGGTGWAGMTLPAAERVALELCTVLEAGNRLAFAGLQTGTEITVALCETGALALAGTGVLTIRDSIVEARPDTALSAPAGQVVLDRVSVGGAVDVRVLEASETIFDGSVTVEDRFHGCVRYSRAPVGATLPRVHRVVFGVPARIVSSNRRDPAWWRLREDCDAAIARGAENGSEMGAFSSTQVAQRMAGFARRLSEFTPAGLVSGIIRID